MEISKEMFTILSKAEFIAIRTDESGKCYCEDVDVDEITRRIQLEGMSGILVSHTFAKIAALQGG